MGFGHIREGNVFFEHADNRWAEKNETTTAPSPSESTVFSATDVTVGETRYITSVDITCNRAGKISIIHKGETIRTGRTSPSERNIPFYFTPALKVLPTEDFDVKFKQFIGSITPIEVSAQGIQK